MGLFGFGGKDITFDMPERQFKSAEDIFRDALGFGREQFPLALGARERGLERIGAGELSPGMGFYEQFQPTSFEQALGAKGFEDIDRRIRQSLSLAGIESSPVLAEQRTRAGVDIGRVLAELGQRRAELALRGREAGILQQMGIDPLQAIQPFTNLAERQDVRQTEADFQKAFQDAIGDFQRRAGRADIGRQIGQIGGGVLGSIFGGLPGGALVSQIGGGIGGMFDPNVQDISNITGQSQQTGGGLDIGVLAELFGGGTAKTGKTQKVNAGQQLFDIFKNL